MSINITCEICGRQKVSLKNLDAKIDIKASQFEGEQLLTGKAGTFVSIPGSKINDLFDVPCPACQSLDF